MACSQDEVIPPLGESGGTDGGDSGPPLPGGDDCGENWYAIDGAPVPQELNGPEAFGGSLANHQSRIEFTGPARQPDHVVPTPINAAFGQMTFEEFAARYAERVGNYWFVEGDQAMTDADLHALYDRLHEQASKGAQPPVPTAAAYDEGGFDAAWSSGRKLTLTWCVGWVLPSLSANEELHAEHVALLIETMEWATRAWERAGDVNFVHLAQYDSPEAQASGQCQPGENGIHFRVRTGPECTGACGGRVFIEALPQYEFEDPANIDGDAEIVFGLQRFFDNEDEARINALHELGHVLGFTHEHLRWPEEQEPESGCNGLGEIPWRGLTPPDRSSVMANDFCAGVNTNVPWLSAWDRLGAYYQYTWGRRRASMMGLVSQVDDYAYDGLGQTGILWQTSRSARMQRWSSTGAPGQPIQFAVEELCADGGAPPCMGAFDSEGRVRPSPALLSGGAFDLDVLFHGPGSVLADSLLLNDGAGLDAVNLDLDWFSVPVVGSFGPGNADQILLYRPGAEEDALLVLEDGDVVTYPMNFPGHAYPLAGRFRGFEGGRNDIVWYDPQNDQVSTWRWTGLPDYDFAANGPADTTDSLGLDAAVEYTPIIGDFNGDAKTDILWYSAGDGADIMWWSESNNIGIFFAASTTQVTHDYRPFVGDFDGNGVDDILWFAPFAEVVGVTSKIWHFAENQTYTSRVLSTRRDYSPYVADFDDDGCSDILWYKPDDSGQGSPLWRCLPNEADFACEPPLTTPEGSYPVGFEGGY
ncbi:FG-GAP-like repeat-containing protein [Enhygromyxa salina]|nr:FG-GAP-like repeat-containing protein [Enhygromyxa salina]